MGKKRFEPQVTRIKLNPEQAVLVCLCYGAGTVFAPNPDGPDNCGGCIISTKTIGSGRGACANGSTSS